MYDPDRKPGPVETLCREIDFRFERGMETEAIFTSFVAVLLGEVEDMRTMGVSLAGVVKGLGPSADSAKAIEAANSMLAQGDIQSKIDKAADVHALCRELNPEETYPTDHIIDMVSSVASAIRFGFEKPCRSRHAAAAADHIWKHRYGLSLFDGFTPNWRNDWTRAQLQKAILRLVPQDNLHTAR